MEEVSKIEQSKAKNKSKPFVTAVLDFVVSPQLRLLLILALVSFLSAHLIGYFNLRVNGMSFWATFGIGSLLVLNLALAFLDFISSVRFGVALLVVLVVLSMVGMLVVQQNVEGFDAFYASLMPAEKLVYGWLGFFDIYNSWYYLGLLLVLSLNIILASIDRFPTAWKFISAPKSVATKAWLLHQKQNAVLTLSGGNPTEYISKTFKKYGFAPKVTEKNGRIHIFGEKGRWNRLGAYVVHIALLLLFLGHFVGLFFGFDADVRFAPGQVSDQIEVIKFDLDQQKRFAAQLPFTITCTDVQQKLIDPKGSIEVSNTLDWRTQIKIDDPAVGTTVADISLNKPFSYRGYRFFQASAITIGAARTMTLELTPEKGGQPVRTELARNGQANLPDGTKIKFEQFWSDFVAGQPESSANTYANPAVKLKVTDTSNQTFDAYAFFNQMPDDAPINKAVGGYKIRMVDFEKSPFYHVLSIRYDPFNGHFVAWYLGGFGLIFALIFVFFISHQRIWALIDGENVTLGGNTNRNHLAFEEKFKKIVNDLGN